MTVVHNLGAQPVIERDDGLVVSTGLRRTIWRGTDNCALVVIDMNRYFTHPHGGRYLRASEKIVPRVCELLNAWRRAQAPVVFTEHGHLDDDNNFARFFSTCLKLDDPDARLISQMERRPDERVVCKSSYDAFLHTPLESYLRCRGVQQIVLVGVLTDMCVETTARSGFCRGFEVIVCSDATASATPERHRNAIAAMGRCCAGIYAARELV